MSFYLNFELWFWFFLKYSIIGWKCENTLEILFSEDFIKCVQQGKVQSFTINE